MTFNYFNLWYLTYFQLYVCERKMQWNSFLFQFKIKLRSLYYLYYLYLSIISGLYFRFRLTFTAHQDKSTSVTRFARLKIILKDSISPRSCV